MNTFFVTFRQWVPRRAVPRTGMINESGFDGACYDDSASFDIQVSRCFPLGILRFWQVRWLNGTVRKHRSRQRENRYRFCYILFRQSRLFRRDRKRWRLRQQRCLEVVSRPGHVNVVDETRRTYRLHGRQRGAPRRIATFHHATLRVAPHRYATRKPLGISRRLSRV